MTKRGTLITNALRKYKKYFLKLKLDPYSIGFDLICYFVLAFLVVPIIIVIFSSFTSGTYITFPPKGVSLRPYSSFLARGLWTRAFANSIIVATCSMCVSTAVGTLIAAGLARRRSTKAISAIYFLIQMPILIPPVITGISLLMYLGYLGLHGTYFSLVVAHSLWSIPIVFLTMRAVLVGLDPIYVEAAMDLGANRIRAFFDVTLPLIKPGLISSAFLAFVLSLGEFIMSLFLTTPSTMVLPVIIWTAMKYEVSPVVSASSVLFILMVFVALVVIEKTVGIEKIKMGT